MTTGAGHAITTAAPDPAAEAMQAALLLAVDPAGLGGAILRASPGPALRHRLRRDPLDEAVAGTRVERALAEVLPA